MIPLEHNSDHHMDFHDTKEDFTKHFVQAPVCLAHCSSTLPAYPLSVSGILLGKDLCITNRVGDAFQSAKDWPRLCIHATSRPAIA